MDVVFTTASSKGQIVLPAGIREELGIRPGAKFAVYGKGDTVVLRRLKVPTVEEFDRLTKDLSSIAKRRGITRSDIEDAIKEVRASKA
ncbi:MAG: AbrB/MazE/SpoVT family DNA-binding domain-containing protein [Candidatus Altiarchaeota archaeon]